ncbi:MAG: hypothetical protein ACTSRA_19300 [Promethearchaeota archaeon]
MVKPKNEFTFILLDISNSMREETISIYDVEDEDKKKKKKKKRKGKGKSSDYVSKFEAAIQVCKEIILTKEDVQEGDTFGIIVYDDNNSKVIQGITSDYDSLIDVLNNIEVKIEEAPSTNKRRLTGAFALVIQEFANQLKIVGNILLRVFILTDELSDFGPLERKLTEIARDIGVYTDILYFGKNLEGIDEDMDAKGYFVEEEEEDDEGDSQLDFELEINPALNDANNVDKKALEEAGLILPGLEPETLVPVKPKVEKPKKKKKIHYKDIREIAQMTDGLFLDGKSSLPVIMRHAKKLGDIKDLEEGLDAFESAPVRKKRLMSAIAEKLVPLGISEIQDEIEGKSNLKCNICFKKESPSGAPFYATGRHCSYCQRTMHLECAAQWAAQDQDSEEPWIFRCPFCFHLLKVEPQVTKLIDLQIVRRNIQKMEQEKAKKKKLETNATQLDPSEIEDLEDPCEMCGVLFEKNDIVLRCDHCGALYHEKCFNETLEENELHCRKCGYRFVSWG